MLHIVDLHYVLRMQDKCVRETRVEECVGGYVRVTRVRSRYTVLSLALPLCFCAVVSILSIYLIARVSLAFIALLVICVAGTFAFSYALVSKECVRVLQKQVTLFLPPARFRVPLDNMVEFESYVHVAHDIEDSCIRLRRTDADGQLLCFFGLQEEERLHVIEVLNNALNIAKERSVTQV